MNGTRSSVPVGSGSERWHGTAGGYSNHRCGCEGCRAAWAAMVARSKARRTASPTPDHVHGTVNGYCSHGCRCEDCTRAQSEATTARARVRRGAKAPAKPYKKRATLEERKAKSLEVAAEKAARDALRAEKRTARAYGKTGRKNAKHRPFAEMFTISRDTECWEWQGKLSRGYGSYRGMNAHRYSYISAGNVVREGQHVDHLCRNRACVNPAHLEAVSPRVNFLRGEHAAAVTLRDGICGNGHAFAGENVRTRMHGDKRQECVQCNRDRSKRYRDAKKLRLAESDLHIHQLSVIM